MKRLEEKFRRAYDALEQSVASRAMDSRYTALGYTSNLDLLCDFRVEKLNELLAQHMAGRRLEQMKIAKVICTMEELLETIVYYCIHGIGGEADVEHPELVRASFPFTNGMGGTGVQAALALAAIGGESIVHLTDDSKEVCDQLVSPHIHMALADGTLGHAGDVAAHNPQEIHFILQFKKGDVVRLGEQAVAIPCSNRVILTKNTVNISLPLWEPYFKWIEQNAKRVSSNVLSSFNSILDPDVLKERLAYVTNHAAIYRRNNPDGVVYFEDAHYHDAEVRRLCVETLYPYVDVLSMNEEELQYTLRDMYHFSVNIDDIYSCVSGVEYLQKKFRIRKGIIVHTKDYAMFVGDPGRTNIENGLMFGTMMATAKAANGGYGSREQIRDVLGFDVSDRGLWHLRRLEGSPYEKRVTLVPTCYIDKPKFTIGLGDSFTGGVQMCF